MPDTFPKLRMFFPSAKGWLIIVLSTLLILLGIAATVWQSTLYSQREMNLALPLPLQESEKK